ncbi:ubiquitin-like domain-containing protein CIP73 isoform X3 [Typha latifolia]|uniref:ubiquitin-like domain-containing protein CIP73 isoform X3 n=1 Tax=Typha latifolia TaxID=4733 RepID=UPI003C2E0A1B
MGQKRLRRGESETERERERVYNPRSSLSPFNLASRIRLRPLSPFKCALEFQEKMESNRVSEVSTSHGDVAGDSETTVDIKIKTLDSQTYNLRVNKCVSVPLLKEQIAHVTGVVSEQQRLICRGKVLKDDELLSAYHVEDGHTLHLVVRQPSQSSPFVSTSYTGLGNVSGHPATTAASNVAQQHGIPVTRSIVLEAINIDQANNNAPHISQGAHNSGDNGPLDSRPPHTSPASMRVGLDSQQSSFRLQSEALGSQQPTVIPDSLATLNQYLEFMRDEFMRTGFSGRRANSDSEAVGMQSTEVLNYDYQTHSAFRHSVLPTPASLAEVVLSTRRLLMEQAAGCLSQLARQLEDHTNITDPLMRRNLQDSVMNSGVLLQQLGSLLLELSRTTMTLRMGQAPSEAVINAGPAVYISGSGPNPVMVQPVPFYPGSISRGHTGALFSGQGLQGEPLGSVIRPRNIEIHIRTGRTVPVTTAGEQAGAQQSQEHADPSSNSSSANASYQAIPGISSSAPIMEESGIRVLPIRTVVAVPAGVDYSPSDLHGTGLGLIYPLLARIQNLGTGNASDARGNQSSTEPSQGVTITNQQSNLEPVMHTQNSESSDRCLTRNDNNLPANREPAAPGFSYQGQQGPHSSNGDPDVQAHFMQQIGENLNQMMDRVGQWVRTESVIGSATDQISTTRNAEMLEVSGASEDGVLFSSLVRQLMPFISQGTTIPDVPVDNHSSSNAQTARESESSSSQHRREPLEGPNTKRQRKND